MNLMNTNHSSDVRSGEIFADKTILMQNQIRSDDVSSFDYQYQIESIYLSCFK